MCYRIRSWRKLINSKKAGVMEGTLIDALKVLVFLLVMGVLYYLFKDRIIAVIKPIINNYF